MNQAYDTAIYPEHANIARAGRLLGPTEVARWLGVSPGWVRDHATRKQPRIKAVKVGRLLRFRAEDIEEFIGRRVA